MMISTSRSSLILIAACVAALGGCTTRGAAMNGNVAQRVQDQMAQNDAAAIKPETDDRGTHLRLIAQMQQKSLYFASLAHIDAFEQKWGASPESSILRADALRQTMQPEAAKALYTQLMATSVKARAAHGLGLLAGRAGDLPTAAIYLTQANQAAPTDADVLNDLGYVLLQQGKWNEARLPLMKASELDAANSRVWSNIALYLTLDGQPQQARAVMDDRKLSDGARAEIAELARAIQHKSVSPAVKSVAAVPAPAAVQAAAIVVPAPTVAMPASSTVTAAPVAAAPATPVAPMPVAAATAPAVVRTVVVAPALPLAPPLPTAPVAAATTAMTAQATETHAAPTAVTTAPVVARDIGVAELNALPAVAGQDITR